MKLIIHNIAVVIAIKAIANLSPKTFGGLSVEFYTHCSSVVD